MKTGTKKKVSDEAQKKAEKERAAATGLPPSPVDDLTDHSTSAASINAQVDPKGKSAAQATSIDKVAAKAADKEESEQKEVDNSIVGKIRRSELFYVKNHSLGENYVGISPQNDPNATPQEKRLSSVQALDGVAPRTGMIVKPKDGGAFTVPDNYGPEKSPADWASVINPATKKPLFG